MRRYLVTLATLLLRYQGLYALYLLAAAQLLLLQGFPYCLFSLSLFNEDSIYLRGLLLGMILRIHYNSLVTWLQGEGAWVRFCAASTYLWAGKRQENPTNVDQ